MRTSIYIDGFNLYYGAVKNTPYKWLDFKAAFGMLLQPHHRIDAIHYFTAQVSGRRDPQQPMRLVRQHHPTKLLGLVFPRRETGGYPSRELSRHANFVLRLGERVLAACQLPDLIPGTRIHKPAAW